MWNAANLYVTDTWRNLSLCILRCRSLGASVWRSVEDGQGDKSMPGSMSLCAQSSSLSIAVLLGVGNASALGSGTIGTCESGRSSSPDDPSLSL